MPDIAQLGLSIDSRQVTAASKALDDLTAAAKPAAAAAANLEKAGVAAGKGAQQMAAGTGLARHEMINLSRQLQDVGVSLASGQSPFMVLAQQGTQIADIFGSSKTGSVGGALKQVASGVVSFLTPMRVLGIATVGLGVAAYALNSSWNTFTLKLDDTARSADTTTRELSKLQAAASFKGIAGDDFSKGIVNFAKGVYDAKNNMGGLAEVFRANNVQARGFDDAMEKAADLIKNAKNDQQRLVLLQQMGLPATMEWVRLLSGGADGLKKAKEAAADFAANDNMIRRAREFDEAWNRAWTNFGLNARSAFQTAMESGRGLFDRLENLATKAGSASIWNNFLPADHAARAKGMGISPIGEGDFASRFPSSGAFGSNPALADALRANADRRNNDPTKDKEAIQRSLSVQQQQLAMYGQTATAAEAVRQVELQVQQARLNGIPIDQKRVEVLKQLAAEQTIGVTAIKANTDAVKIDAATVGMSVENATRYAAAQNAINEARRVGRELTPENIAQIQREAAALGQAAAQADMLRFSYESLVRGPLQTFTSAISNGATAWDAFKKAGISALNSLASKLADIAAQNLWASAFGGSSGFGLGSLFGLGGSAPVMSGTGLGAGTGGLSFPMFAGGTNSAPGGWSIVGEDGPELMNVPKGAQILPNGVSPPGSGSTQGVHVTVGVSVDNNGNLQAYVKNVAQGEASRTVNGAMNSPSFVDRVGAASVKARSRRLT